MGNSCGDTEDYFQAMERHVGACGGLCGSGAIIPLICQIQTEWAMAEILMTRRMTVIFVLMD